MKSDASRQLKMLQTTRDKIETEVKELLVIKREHDQNYETAKSRLKELTGKIAEFEINSVRPIITEHAYLRYLERAKGIVLADLQDEILSPNIIAIINLLHSCKIPFGERLTLVVRNRTIVTVIENHCAVEERIEAEKPAGGKINETVESKKGWGRRRKEN